MTPDAIPNKFRPHAAATSVKRPTLSVDVNADGGSKYFDGMPDGYSPRVMSASVSSHFTSSESGFCSRYLRKYSTAFLELAVCAYRSCGFIGNRHLSPGFRYTSLSTSDLCR